MRHASFFSGVGGLDLGFERAGIETVSVSEIDPYANTVLAERFPGAPNLGSITEINADDIPEADIWSGGFPCQDLSVAGKRAGFSGKRSSLAFTFLDLVERRRPRWLVLENVPGLFSSNQGRDFLRLLSEMDDLGYSVAWRTLDARYFGVAQRRRRVFIVASLEPNRAEQVLFECEGVCGHLAPSKQTRQGVASGTPDGSGIAGAITRRFSKGVNSTIDEPLILAHAVRASLAKRGERGDGSDDLIISQATDADRVRAADGVARRLDNQQGVAATLTSPQGGGRRDRIPLALAARKSSFGHYEMTEQGGTLKSSGGDIGGGSENIAILSFPSRFGSNANVTEGQAQSMAHSAGAPAVLLDTQGGTDQEDDLLADGAGFGNDPILTPGIILTTPPVKLDLTHFEGCVHETDKYCFEVTRIYRDYNRGEFYPDSVSVEFTDKRVQPALAVNQHSADTNSKPHGIVQHATILPDATLPNRLYAVMFSPVSVSDDDAEPEYTLTVPLAPLLIAASVFPMTM